MPAPNLLHHIVFYMLSVMTVGCAVGVVTSRDLLRSALWLVGTFAGMAAFFVLLNAEFLGVVQLFIYIGAISILIVFAIVFTANLQRGNLTNTLARPGGVIAVLLLGALLYAALGTDWNSIDTLPAATQEDVDRVMTESVGRLGDLLVTNFVLPFEITSVLIVAALVGALALVRGQGRGK